MIQRLDNVLWLRSADGQLEPWDEAGLADYIVVRIGPIDDETAEAMAAALMEHARRCAEEEPLAQEQMDAWVDELGVTMGWKVPTAGQRVAEIRLDELAAASQFELGFFRQLAERLAEWLRTPYAGLRVTGLRACALRLRGRRRWGPACARLANEICEYIRARAAVCGTGMVAIVE